jgi:hypothetical protein
MKLFERLERVVILTRRNMDFIGTDGKLVKRPSLDAYRAAGLVGKQNGSTVLLNGDGYKNFNVDDVVTLEEYMFNQGLR